MKSRISFLAITFALLLFFAPAALAQAPGWSRGQQDLAITYDECMRRGPAALQAEGYRIDYNAGNFAVGIKNVHTAVIICSPAPDSKMLVQIVVASNGEGGGTERQQLQARMEQPGLPPRSGGGGNVPPSSGGNSGGGHGPLIKWNESPLVPQRGNDKSGQRFTYTCPSNGTPSDVFGTDTYTDDSPICPAAVHAGLITFASGGTVTVELRRPGLTYYTGSSRNGVTSRSYDNRPNPTLGAYFFVR
jgi:hypothetical protein